MSKFIDADRLLVEIEKERRKALDAYYKAARTYDIGGADYLAEAILIIMKMQKEQTETATGTVFTNTNPKILIADSDQWAALLGQFDNGQRVRIILVKEDAE